MQRRLSICEFQEAVQKKRMRLNWNKSFIVLTFRIPSGILTFQEAIQKKKKKKKKKKRSLEKDFIFLTFRIPSGILSHKQFYLPDVSDSLGNP
ncbi:unnamed protein product [Dibothriocephalus latus]|uniref:Uncharacterized protein n=1 Tax=Dibothriocephalus latus TaxID=60516 RepID=A0A3P7QXL2_DIBLA|nr:unnamed protein product [Dibothriocephalus latus]